MTKKEIKDGKIITFYSYKGGVGRSMALANIAVLLAQWGYKTLIIDWDLEAPGLENFYKDYINPKETRARKGLIDLLHSAKNIKESTPLEWKNCLTPIKIESAQIDLITSGNRNENYYELVRSFDFKEFYEKSNGSDSIENLRNEWKKEYDFTLIDSRTGVTDIGGVCTIQLPDILVLLFTPTFQGFEGVLKVAKSARENQSLLPFDRVNLLILPVPTRIDNNEFELSKKWYDIFEDKLEEIYAHWLPKTVSRKNFLICTKIPYISYFSFDEKLPVIEDNMKDATRMGYAYESVAGLIANKLNNPDLLVEKRPELIDLAINPHKRETINIAAFVEHAEEKGTIAYVKRSKKAALYFSSLILIALLSYIGYLKFEESRLQRKYTIANNLRIADSLRKVDSTEKIALSPGRIALKNALAEMKAGAGDLPDKPNYGQFVKKYNAKSHINEGHAWSASFISWCYNKDQDYFQSSARVGELENYFTKNNLTYHLSEIPQPGDIILFNYEMTNQNKKTGGRAIGIVYSYSVSDSILQGIEGDIYNRECKCSNISIITYSRKQLREDSFTFVKIPIPARDFFNKHASFLLQRQLDTLKPNFDSVKKYLTQNADFNLKGMVWTPLHLAAGNNDTLLIRLLISKGVYVNILNDKNVSPLWSAAKDNAIEAARILLEQKDIYVNTVSSNGTAPLDLAKSDEMRKLLISHGAKRAGEIKINTRTHSSSFDRRFN